MEADVPFQNHPTDQNSPPKPPRLHIATLQANVTAPKKLAWKQEAADCIQHKRKNAPWKTALDLQHS